MFSHKGRYIIHTVRGLSLSLSLSPAPLISLLSLSPPHLSPLFPPSFFTLFVVATGPGSFPSKVAEAVMSTYVSQYLFLSVGLMVASTVPAIARRQGNGPSCAPLAMARTRRTFSRCLRSMSAASRYPATLMSFLSDLEFKWSGEDDCDQRGAAQVRVSR